MAVACVDTRGRRAVGKESNGFCPVWERAASPARALRPNGSVSLCVPLVPFGLLPQRWSSEPVSPSASLLFHCPVALSARRSFATWARIPWAWMLSSWCPCFLALHVGRQCVPLYFSWEYVTRQKERICLLPNHQHHRLCWVLYDTGYQWQAVSPQICSVPGCLYI